MSVPIARRNALHEKGKLIMEVLSVAASLAMILLVIGLRSGLYATLTAFIDNVGADLLVAQKGVEGLFSSDSAVALDLHDDIRAVAGASKAGHIAVADIIFSRGETKTPVVLVGFEPGTGFGSPWELSSGRMLAADDEIMLDSWLAERVAAGLGDTVELLGMEFTVVGLTRGTASWMSPYIFVSLSSAEEILGLSNLVSFHLLRFEQGADLAAVKSRIQHEFDGVVALTPREIAEADQRVVATIMDTPILIIIAISVVIGVAVMALAAYTSVSDRIREYGTLKAVGAGPANLSLLVIRETLIQTSLGFLLGLLLAYGSADLIMSAWPQFTIVIEPLSVVTLAGLSVGMSALASLLPIRRIRNIDPLFVFQR
jgi:putative ABC transport system permease protein